MSDGLFNALDISGTGMSAERFRMEVIANNIANAQTTRDKDSPDGSAFRRKQVVFETELASAMSGDRFSGLRHTVAGVRVADVVADMSTLEKIKDPTHPHADAEGYVSLPNVSLPNEMVDLVTATRVYEANLKAIQSFKQMVEQTLQVLRS
jgi:flagellar basal-body rod protein FlgC